MTAFDKNGAKLDVVRAWTQNTFHEGFATSNSNNINVTDSVFTRSNQGVEAGYGGPNLSISQSVILGNKNLTDPTRRLTLACDSETATTAATASTPVISRRSIW